MNAKNVVLIGMVVCAISVLLMSPALANGDDYVLGIYGNANEDDTIDMRDLTYVKLIFFGKKPETELADAKYDGKINPLDFIQIKLIIVGKESEITLVDSADRIVTIHKPAERIVIVVSGGTGAVSILDVKDKVVGVPQYIVDQAAWGAVPLYPELAELPSIGYRFDPDIEAILSLNPDFVMLYRDSLLLGYDPAEPLEQAGVPAIYLDLWNPPIMTEEMERLGYIFGKRADAEEYINFYEGYEDYFRDRTDGLSEAEKPKVYLEDWDGYYAWGDGGYYDRLLQLAGGKNIAAGVETDEWGFLQLDGEFVAYQNPDIIIRTQYSGVGYAVDDSSAMEATREEILSRPELATVSAVENEKCYLHGGFEQIGKPTIVTAYFAKWVQPDLFDDLDPQAVHQEYLDKFFGDADFSVDEHGTFVYPPPEEW